MLYLVYYPPDKRWVSWVPGSVPEARPSKLWRNIKRAFRPANYAGNDEPSSPESDASFDFRNVSYAAITSRRSIQPAETAASPEWRMSTNYAVLTGLHLAVCGFVTLLLLLLLPKASNPPVHPDPDPLPGPHQESHDVRLVRLWATFLGLLSTLLALFQYIVSLFPVHLAGIADTVSHSATNNRDMAKQNRRKSLNTDDADPNAWVGIVCVLTDHQTGCELDCVGCIHDQ